MAFKMCILKRGNTMIFLIPLYCSACNYLLRSNTTQDQSSFLVLLDSHHEKLRLHTNPYPL